MKTLITFLIVPFLSNVSMAQTQLGAGIESRTWDVFLGQSVSISADGRIVAVGGSSYDEKKVRTGLVRVYQYNSGIWTRLGEDIFGVAINDLRSNSVAISADGSIVAFGEPYNNVNGNSSGQVRIYKYTSGAWTQLGSPIDGTGENDHSGQSVSLSADGSIVAIGSPLSYRNFYESGQVRVYKYDAGAWNQLGSNIYDESTLSESGTSVSLSADGSIVAIGAPKNDARATNAGQVRIFKYNAGSWTQLGGNINGKKEMDDLGFAVSLSADGSTVAAGGRYNSSNNNSGGNVSIYKFISGVWTQLGAGIDGEDYGSWSGYAVSLSGDGSLVAFGAPLYDVNEFTNHSGRVKIYKYKSGNWNQLGVDINGTASYDRLGNSVSLSPDGKTVVLGAPTDGGNIIYSGYVQVYTLDNLSYIDQTNKGKTLSIYPNPATKEIKITADASLIGNTYKILNSTGQEVLNGTITEKTTRIDLGNLSAGYYLLSVGENNIQTHKLVIE